MKAALVCGGGGFGVGHLMKRLKAEGLWVRRADLRRHEFAESAADDFIVYVDECLEGTLRLMRFDFPGPVKIGSEEMVPIDQLAELIMRVAGETLKKRHVPGPLGVRGRNFDNRLIRERLDWAPSMLLTLGLERTYAWVEQQVRASGG